MAYFFEMNARLEKILLGFAPILTLVLVTILFSGFGCACDKKTQTQDEEEQLNVGTGSAGEFILQQAIVRGARPLTTNNLPVITSKWSYSKDEYGVVIQFDKSNYKAIESFVLEAFGKPKLGPLNTSNGGKLGMYRFTSKGGVLQFGRDNKKTFVGIVRPLNQKEFSEFLTKAFQSKEFQERLNNAR